ATEATATPSRKRSTSFSAGRDESSSTTSWSTFVPGTLFASRRGPSAALPLGLRVSSCSRSGQIGPRAGTACGPTRTGGATDRSRRGEPDRHDEGRRDLRHTYATFRAPCRSVVFAVSRCMGSSIAMIDYHYGHSREHAVSLLDALAIER